MEAAGGSERSEGSEAAGRGGRNVQALAALVAAAFLVVPLALAVVVAAMRSPSAPQPAVQATPVPRSGTLFFAPRSYTGPIEFRSADVAWVVVSGSREPYPSLVYRTADGGDHWQLTRSVPHVFWARFFDPQRAVPIAGSYPSDIRTYRTIDGGSHWQTGPPFPSLDAFWRASFISPAEGWILVSHGVHPYSIDSLDLYHTQDGGEHWSVLTHTDRQVARSGLVLDGVKETLEFVDSRRGWLSSRSVLGRPRLDLYTTSDGGRSWSGQPLALPVEPGPAEGLSPLSPLFFTAASGVLPLRYAAPVKARPEAPGSESTCTGPRMAVGRGRRQGPSPSWIPRQMERPSALSTPGTGGLPGAKPSW